MILDFGASNLVWTPPAVSSRWVQPVLGMGAGGMEWVNPSKREGLRSSKICYSLNVKITIKDSFKNYIFTFA